MEAKKTPAGTWTCCAYYKDANGKVHRPRFTANRKKEAERLAEECSREHANDYVPPKKQRINGKLVKVQQNLTITFADAAERYIKTRENVLAPDTVREYRRSLASGTYDDISDLEIHTITQDDIQIMVNAWAKNKSPKTVRNYHGFLASVFKKYRPEFILATTLPQKQKPVLCTPTDDDVKTLMEHVKDTRMEIPVILAATASLRRSEICALTIDDIGDGWIRVNKALVQDENMNWVVKTTKTEQGSRTTYLPTAVTNRIKQLVQSGRVVEMNPNVISHAFPHVLKQAGLPSFRFHDLRAYYASVLHYLKVPDKYIMEWGGWKDQKTLQESYQRALPDKAPELAQIGIKHFEEML